jgi:DeoR/GlpR family transcriptional regulator of sugar metabolism
MLLVAAERKMMEQSQQVVLLADSGKFGQQALVRLCDLSQVDTVISDVNLPPDQRKAVEDAGCELIIADA